MKKLKEMKNISWKNIKRNEDNCIVAMFVWAQNEIWKSITQADKKMLNYDLTFDYNLHTSWQAQMHNA